MAEPVVQAVTRLTECCTLLAVGYNLKQAGVLRTSDGETAIKVATTLTLPSLIVQALGNGGPLGVGSLSLLGVATVCMGAQLAATWLNCMQRPKRELAVLAGSSTGLSLRLFGYPLVDCFMGPVVAAGSGAGAAASTALAGGAAAVTGAAALQAVALVDLLNHVAVWAGSYLLFATAGPAFPESFKHEDGGDYRGQWRGMRKEGLGVYTYASGARYEGEWRNNVKEGRGVYYFPKGGVYEGEWSAGSMNGLGVRTFSTGQVKAGRWRDGKLEAQMELWQVALAADGATAVAAAARSVEVGGGRLVDAAQMLVAQPTLWALLAGLAVNLLRVPLPTSVDLVTAALAQANTPLMLLAAGVTAPSITSLPSLKPLLPDLARLLGARLLVPLTVGITLVLLAAASAGNGGVVATGTLLPLTATLMALLAPVPPQALVNARRFRLNEATASAITTASYLACLPLMALAGLAACAAGLVGGTSPAATANVRPLLAFTAAALAAVSIAISIVVQRERKAEEHGSGAANGAASASGGGADGAALAGSQGQRVLMVYAGPVDRTESTGSPSPSSAAAASPSPPSSSASSSSPSSQSAGTPSGSVEAGDAAGSGRAEASGSEAEAGPSGSGGSSSGDGSRRNGGQAGGGGGGAPGTRAAAEWLQAGTQQGGPAGSCRGALLGVLSGCRWSGGWGGRCQGWRPGRAAPSRATHCSAMPPPGISAYASRMASMSAATPHMRYSASCQAPRAAAASLAPWRQGALGRGLLAMGCGVTAATMRRAVPSRLGSGAKRTAVGHSLRVGSAAGGQGLGSFGKATSTRMR